MRTVRSLVLRRLGRVGARVRRAGLRHLLRWLIVGVFAFALMFFNVGLTAVQFSVPAPVVILAAGGQSAALVLTLVRPRAATAVQFLAVALFAVGIPPGSESPWPLTVPGTIALTAHIGLTAARTPRRTALVTWWGSLLLLMVMVLVDPRGRTVMDGLGIMIAYPIASGLVFGVTLAVRHWRGIRRELAAARHDVEVEQSQRALVEERTRIARELHDVVAHSMSVIHMQATSASYRIANLDPAAKAEFARIAAGARSALREMRQLLSVLRDEDADVELAPVPDLRRLPELVESAGRAGVPVEVREADAVRAAVVPESVGLAAYRIVQESLSNVIRHAPGARTRIRLDLDGPTLVLLVENDVAAHPAQRLEAPNRGGHGLAGMRERVRQVGGSLETGARDEGGYRVAARLPIVDHE